MVISAVFLCDDNGCKRNLCLLKYNDLFSIKRGMEKVSLAESDSRMFLQIRVRLLFFLSSGEGEVKG
jgi:hypothetical protein